MKSILQTDDKCFICGRAFGTETHHCFGGANRRFSEEDGLTVRLCRQCHDELHFDPDLSYPLQKAMHEKGQEAYEKAGHTREEFLERYGKNYL